METTESLDLSISSAAKAKILDVLGVSWSDQASQKNHGQKNHELSSSASTWDKVIRIEVVSGGCSGLTYQLDVEARELAKQGDQEGEINGIPVRVDMRSYLYLAGTMLDFSEGLEGKGFHFVNPNASRTCSCGESFSV
jgi:iron-sulfur cluster assembly protein